MVYCRCRPRVDAQPPRAERRRRAEKSRRLRATSMAKAVRATLDPVAAATALTHGLRYVSHIKGVNGCIRNINCIECKLPAPRTSNVKQNGPAGIDCLTVRIDVKY